MDVLEASAEVRSARRGESSPERRCIASGEVRPKDQLLRFVIGPEDRVVLDLTGTLPGRGLWLSPRRDMIEKACARNLFARAAKSSARVPEDLPEQVEGALRRRCLDLIGLARRAGQAVAGFDKVKAWLAGGKAAVLIEASDGGADGRRKISAVGRGVTPGLPIVELFDAASLGQTMGRDRAVHVAMAPGRLSLRFLAEAGRLAEVVPACHLAAAVGPEGH
jgi:predicted RNA-binding protein YlxR (DUF448 family)